MPNKSSKITAIVGAQWGDEGKGKITDFFAGEADFVVRFHGGNNAGHTVIVNNNTYKLHLIPSGVLYEHPVSNYRQRGRGRPGGTDQRNKLSQRQGSRSQTKNKRQGSHHYAIPY